MYRPPFLWYARQHAVREEPRGLSWGTCRALASARMCPRTARSTERLYAMHSHQRWVGLTLLAFVACTHQPVTVAPDGLQDIAPLQAQVDSYLMTLTERWATGGTSGEVQVGAFLRRVLVDDPQAPLRLRYVTSQLDVATVVSPTFYRPHAYQARYQLTLQVESPAIGTRQAWLQGTGEGLSMVSVERAIRDALTQAVRGLCHQLVALRDARVFQGGGF